jgi:hypothetical protein
MTLLGTDVIARLNLAYDDATDAKFSAAAKVDDARLCVVRE